MPKTKKKKEKENWFGVGFLVGALFGAPVYFVALGYLNPNQMVRFIAKVVTLFAFLSAWVLAVVHAVKKKSLIDPLAEGMIMGFGFITLPIDWYLNGIPFL